jgi:putative two-component system response regulator
VALLCTARNVLKAHDSVTLEHVSRMSLTSRLIGICCGMTEREADLLSFAAGMHDLGKTEIPVSLLLKPGKLDRYEWAVMKTHTTIGADIIGNRGSERYKAAKIVILTHHERWDGRGYPQGLRGEQIPLMGRIVSISDVFDALTSERPYKRTWGEEEAIEEIKKGSGSHFDPTLIPVFLEVFPEIRKAICQTMG